MNKWNFFHFFFFYITRKKREREKNKHKISIVVCTRCLVTKDEERRTKLSLFLFKH